MSYNIIVPREFQAEYEAALADITGEDSGFANFLGKESTDMFSQMFGASFVKTQPPEIDEEIFKELQKRFGLLMTGLNQYKILYVKTL